MTTVTTRTAPKVPWSDRLAFEIALHLEGSGEPLETILGAHKIAPIDFAVIANDKVFDNKVRSYRDEIATKGLTFRLKAKAQAEELLTTSWNLIHNPDVSPAVKADLIKSTVKWADLEPKSSESIGGNSGGVKITINLAGEPMAIKADIIDVTPELSGPTDSDGSAAK